MGNLCCSSRRDKNANMVLQDYPNWEKDDFNQDGSLSKEQINVEDEIKQNNYKIL